MGLYWSEDFWFVYGVFWFVNGVFQWRNGQKKKTWLVKKDERKKKKKENSPCERERERERIVFKKEKWESGFDSKVVEIIKKEYKMII